MPEVFPIQPKYPLTHSLQLATYVADMGDGFEQRVNKNVAYSRADGEGQVTSYKGRNSFGVTLGKLYHVNETPAVHTANLLWNFYKARSGALEAFYFYNPTEADIDLTGTSTTGRYLVRFKDSNLSREQFVWKLFNATVELIETRA